MSDRAARSFESVAAEYERHRPEYPEEALRWAAEQLGLAPGARVLDVGAGTGKLTRGLVALGFDVVAVEPGGADARRSSGVAVPEAEALEAPAEAIPLPDASVDAAFAGQAFHWFDRERALPELHRVIRPGGGLALLWNWWDERDPLQRELGELDRLRGPRALPRGGAAGRAVVPRGGPDRRRDARGVEPGRTRRLPLDRRARSSRRSRTSARSRCARSTSSPRATASGSRCRG